MDLSRALRPPRLSGSRARGGEVGLCAVSYADGVRDRIPDSVCHGDAFIDSNRQPDFYPQSDRNAEPERVGITDRHSEPLAGGDPYRKFNADAEQQCEQHEVAQHFGQRQREPGAHAVVDKQQHAKPDTLAVAVSDCDNQPNRNADAVVDREPQSDANTLPNAVAERHRVGHALPGCYPKRYAEWDAVF